MTIPWCLAHGNTFAAGYKLLSANKLYSINSRVLQHYCPSTMLRVVLQYYYATPGILWYIWTCTCTKMEVSSDNCSSTVLRVVTPGILWYIWTCTKMEVSSNFFTHNSLFIHSSTVPLRHTLLCMYPGWECERHIVTLRMKTEHAIDLLS